MKYINAEVQKSYLGKSRYREVPKYLLYFVQVYGKSGLLGPKTILAHCVHLTDEEVEVV